MYAITIHYKVSESVLVGWFQVLYVAIAPPDEDTLINRWK
jgi:hypothetical protein